MKSSMKCISALDSDGPRPACFVCGCPQCAIYPLYISQPPTHVPFFPFLENHEGPAGALPPSVDGYVLSCYLCFSYLTKQWESYERDKIPPVKRIYWLKRVDKGPYTGVEMGMQSEYASQFLGINYDSQSEGGKVLGENLSSVHTKTGVARKEIMPHMDTASELIKDLECKDDYQDEALDLSIEKVSKNESCQSCEDNADVLDLSMPDVNSSTEVCYVCGEHFKKGTLITVHTKAQSIPCPYFPSLVLHSRPSRSLPMDAFGRVRNCMDCYLYLLDQWNLFEVQKVPQTERHYHFKKQAGNSRRRSSTHLCSQCCLMFPPEALYVSDGSRTFQNLLSQFPSGVHSFKHPVVLFCLECCKVMLKNSANCGKKDEPVHGYEVKQDQSVIHSNVVLPVCSTAVSSSSVEKFGEITKCFLCNQNCPLSSMQWISMVPEASGTDGMYFPFLKFLHFKSETIVKDGMVLACSCCYKHLSSQWIEYEKEGVPLSERQFSNRNLLGLSTSPPLMPLNDLVVTESLHGKVLPYVDNIVKERQVNFELSKQSLKLLEVFPPKPDLTVSLPHVSVPGRPLNIALNCYICGFFSKPGLTFALYSTTHGSDPYFPFLKKQVPLNQEAKIDNSCFLVCFCCFHSLVLQWHKYELMHVEQYLRFYDTSKYTCFVCSLKTYRKRVHILPVKDYPFLRDHNAPPMGLIVNQGQSVVVCKDCYYSLKAQYSDLERYGVPVEKRQYNWIKRPAPLELVQESSVGSGGVSHSSCHGGSDSPQGSPKAHNAKGEESLIVGNPALSVGGSDGDLLAPARLRNKRMRMSLSD